MEREITVEINGEQFSLRVAPWRTLLDVLRNDLGLTGTKEGCGQGECGACTVLLNGKAVNSCLLLIGEVEGGKILTIEGLSQGEKLHPIQASFIKHGAVQCGFCTPGMILSAKALLDENPGPTQQEIKQAMIGNLCRCTGYQNIIQAILALSK
ncbi:MAG: (2Fe-2S)-binding protein [Candidatus Tectomicrobia bacterium]|uniref:(2Fe-2S)-binding protein n=1 Tax=Tectimicrobiota bacterium TaxID=2528274 RepID=A0A933GJM3_UNCTE|nr:(2Fe-2S)-binding protein [Candidatus Tectomicrobia bacterium]